MSENHRQLVHRWFDEVWNQGKRETIDELLGPECVTHDGSVTVKGPQSCHQFFDRMQSGFSRIHIDCNEFLSEGDMCCVRWLATMSHTGDLPGLTSTGKEIRVTGISVFRIVDGRFEEAWQNWDMLGMVEQLGLAPPTGLFFGAPEANSSAAAG
jgi:predicted ester cyclase